MTDVELFPPTSPSGDKDGEDSVDKIEDRLAAVREVVHREDRRQACYAAAMSRRWGLPAENFVGMKSGPAKLALAGRGYVYKNANENGGVKTLIELCLRSLDHAYEQVGDAMLPAVQLPTAYEHNNCLCIVKTPVVSERERRKRKNID